MLWRKFVYLCLAGVTGCGALAASAAWETTVEPMLISNMADRLELPRNFRMANQPYKAERVEALPEGTALPSREGLDTLNISGSSQFSEKGLEAILETVGAKERFFVVDLREECHGFADGQAISWYGPHDWGNIGKIPATIDAEEKARLAATLSGELQIFENKRAEEAVSLAAAVAKTEKEVVRGHNVRYHRIYATDHVRPTDIQVDRFLRFYKEQRNYAWLHFHCAAGKGRTTTFMAMVDIINNADKVSFEEILLRQWLVGGHKLDKPVDDTSWKKDYAVQRVEFLRSFYEYVRENPHLALPWRLWVEQHKTLTPFRGVAP